MRHSQAASLLADALGLMLGLWASIGGAVVALMLIANPVLAQTCDLPTERTRVVLRVEDASTLTLDDGTEVVLVGALPPQNLEPGSDPDQKWQPAELSRAALEKLVAGKAVELAFSGRRLDRYGRQLAQVFLRAGPDRIWVQSELIRNGWARAYGLPGTYGCESELLEYERRARLTQQGHWSTQIFQDRDASEPRELAKFRDSFQTIEGRVAKTTRIRGNTVLDFSADDRMGFSVWIAPRRNGRRTGTASTELIGQRIRVRGWIEIRRSPRLTLNDDRFVEILADEAAGPPAMDGNAPDQSGSYPIPAVTRTVK